MFLRLQYIDCGTYNDVKINLKRFPQLFGFKVPKAGQNTKGNLNINLSSNIHTHVSLISRNVRRQPKK
jgi:hypothetical protein